jgi:hypothetical protein
LTLASFRTKLELVENVWFLLDELDIHPKGGLPKHHLLWALHFMKAYPLQAQGCAAVGGSDGTVDPKTYRKWVCEAISDLELKKVSLLLRVFLIKINTSLTHHLPTVSFFENAILSSQVAWCTPMWDKNSYFVTS